MLHIKASLASKNVSLGADELKSLSLFKLQNMCHNYRTKANRILKANASKEHCLAKTVEDLDQLWGKRMGLILIS